MNGYTDLHCHILPGLDDGADNIEETLKMLRIAYKEGIRTVFATPHYHPRRGCATSEEVLTRFAKVYRYMKQEFPDMEMYEGNEIYFTQEVISMLKQGELLTLGNSKYVLIEFSVMETLTHIREAVNDVLRAGFFPVLAHVERYESIANDIETLCELVDGGTYLQVNADSVCGGSGAKDKKHVRNMLRENLVHFIGTDAHSAGMRSPKIKKCADYLNRKYGKETADRILFYNPQCLIENGII